MAKKVFLGCANSTPARSRNLGQTVFALSACVLCRALSRSGGAGDVGRVRLNSSSLCLKYIYWALARQAPWRHLLHSWLAQSKPGQSAQACTRQAQSAIDGARRLVWPEPYAYVSVSVLGRIKVQMKKMWKDLALHKYNSNSLRAELDHTHEQGC